MLGLQVITASAQLKKFELGINGLTCSQCSRNVEMSLRKLPFVQDVQMNLEHTEGEIFFKDHADVDIAKVAKAVVDAGFSVRYLKGAYNVTDLKVIPDNCTDVLGKKFVFVKQETKTLNGLITVQFIGDKYMPKKEARQWQADLKDNCGSSTHPFFVTLVQ